MPNPKDIPSPDDLDRMVDQVAENPERADFVKRVLRQALAPGVSPAPPQKNSSGVSTAPPSSTRATAPAWARAIPWRTASAVDRPGDNA